MREAAIFIASAAVAVGVPAWIEYRADRLRRYQAHRPLAWQVATLLRGLAR